jgi:hypothetical protein
MKKKILIILALVIVASLVLSVLSAAAAEKKVGLTIKNRTDRKVFVSLLSPDETAVYWLDVPAGETMYFTVPSAVYTHTTVACGLTATGTVDVTHWTTLSFPACDKTPPNPGERSIEKISLYDTPDRGDFNYQYD